MSVNNTIGHEDIPYIMRKNQTYLGIIVIYRKVRLTSQSSLLRDRYIPSQQSIDYLTHPTTITAWCTSS